MNRSYHYDVECQRLDTMLKEFRNMNFSSKKKMKQYLKNLKLGMKNSSLYLSEYDLNEYMSRADEVAQVKCFEMSVNTRSEVETRSFKLQNPFQGTEVKNSFNVFTKAKKNRSLVSKIDIGQVKEYDIEPIQLFENVQKKLKSIGQGIKFHSYTSKKKLKSTVCVGLVVALCGCGIKSDKAVVPQTTVATEQTLPETPAETTPVVEEQKEEKLDVTLNFDLKDMDHNAEIFNKFFAENVKKGVDLTDSQIADAKKDLDATIANNIIRWQDYFIVRNFDQVTVEFLYDYLGDSSRTYNEIFENYMRTVDEICMKAITSTAGNEWTLQLLVASKADARAEEEVLKLLSAIATAKKNGNEAALNQAIEEARKFIVPFMNNNGYSLKPTTIYEISQLIQAGKQLLITSPQASLKYLSEDEMLRLATMEKDCGIDKSQRKGNRYSSTIMNDGTNALLGSMRDKFEAVTQFRIAKIVHETDKDEKWLRDQIFDYLKENNIIATFEMSETLEIFLYGKVVTENTIRVGKNYGTTTGTSSNQHSTGSTTVINGNQGTTQKSNIPEQNVPESSRQQSTATYEVDGRQVATATGEAAIAIQDAQLQQASDDGSSDAAADWREVEGSKQAATKNPRPRANYSAEQVAAYTSAYNQAYDTQYSVWKAARNYKHTTTERWDKDEWELEDDRVTNGGTLPGTTDQIPSYDTGTSNNGQSTPGVPPSTDTEPPSSTDFIPNKDGDTLVDQDVIDQGTLGGDSSNEGYEGSEVVDGGILPNPSDSSSQAEDTSQLEGQIENELEESNLGDINVNVNVKTSSSDSESTSYEEAPVAYEEETESYEETTSEDSYEETDTLASIQSELDQLRGWRTALDFMNQSNVQESSKTFTYSC